MGSINNIVNVNISRQTSVPTRAGFGTGAFLSAYATFTPAAKSYASYAEVADDAEAGSDSLAFAAVYFGQKAAPKKLTIIKDKGDSEVGTIVFDAALITDNIVTVTLDGVTIGSVTFATDNAATLTAIAALIGIHTQVLSAVSDGVDTITVTFADKKSHTLTVAVTGGATQATGTYTPTTPADSDPAGSLTDAVNVLNDWYALSIWSRVSADITAVAAWVQAQGTANPKLFFAQSSDANILDSGSTTDIASTLKAATYFRTSLWYHSNDAEYLDGGVMGGQLPSAAGSITWAYKSVSGVTVDTLSSGEKAAAHAKACNTYDTVASTNITEEGKVSDSPFEWIDVIRGVDWIQVNMAADIFTALVNNPKIPYDTTGISLIGGIVKSVLTRAQAQGILNADVKPVVNLPALADISAADKGNRVLNGITFTGVLAGAVQKVNIQGVVTL